ncbi:alpha-acetolactate decarboxylase [Trichoderma velutinum]
MEYDEVFQYSIVSALMDGVASHGIPLSRLVCHGDHGLGTFRYMVGEMIVMDGRVWQMKSDGTVSEVGISNPEIIAPFAMITRFRPTVRIKALFSNKHHLTAQLCQLFPEAKNLYLGLRIEGFFKSVTVRTTAGQQYPSQRLIEISESQVSHTLSGMGTMIGFRSPQFSQDISVAGIHLHFISADKKCGGHVLTLETEKVELLVAVLSQIHLELPADSEFNAAQLKQDADGIVKVEG